MNQKTQILQKRYDGFLKTNCLWNENSILDLQQFSIKNLWTKINLNIDEKLRLGKYVERLVSFQLQQESTLKIIAENIQIQKDKITLGELDCVLLKDEKPIHLEIIYKFYLYDTSVGNSEIENLIGPNRKDSLIEKLIKLKEKQLPLLYSDECKYYLKTLNLEIKNIEQQVYFKAQLFIPIHQKVNLSQLNSDCIVGFYINRNDLNEFSNCKFYLPIKRDWLIIPHKNVNWKKFDEFITEITPLLDRKFSPLCWLKKENGELEKFFLIWW